MERRGAWSWGFTSGETEDACGTKNRKGNPVGTVERLTRANVHTVLSQEKSVTLTTVIFEKAPCNYHEFERQFLVSLNLLDRHPLIVLHVTWVLARSHCQRNIGDSACRRDPQSAVSVGNSSRRDHLTQHQRIHTGGALRMQRMWNRFP